MTRLSRLSRAEDGERGAFLVLYVILVVAIFTMAAIAVDLASLRQDRRGDRAAADAGVAAGALSLSEGAGGPLAGCIAAWNGAVRNLGMAVPGPGLSTNPCQAAGSPITSTTTCLSTDAARTVSATVNGYTVTITTPVPDANTLLNAETAGGDTTQAVNTNYDGSQCDRIAVTIAYTRASFFGNIVNSKNNSTTVHSVARALTGPGIGKPIPALVALNPHACQTINAGTGLIEAKNNGTKPALIQADSDASGCNNSSHVLEVQGSGVHIKADPGTGTPGTPGLLDYYAINKPAQSYDSSRPTDYVGALTQLTKQITRGPIDEAVHCSAVAPTNSSYCLPTADPYLTQVLPYAASAPPIPFQTFPGLGQSCGTPPSSFSKGNWLVNCPTGFTVGGPVNFGGGIIVVTGAVNIVSGGDLRVNDAAGTTQSSGPAAGLPTLDDSTVNTLLVVRGVAGVTMQSSASSMHLGQTLIYTPFGGASLQGGPTISWSSYQGTGLSGLLYWTESSTTTSGACGTVTCISFGGGPNFVSDGIVLIPNGRLSIQGSGTLNATNVQFWADNVETQGAAQFILQPDPNQSFKSSGAITHLIR
jgi:hypothetical protein